MTAPDPYRPHLVDDDPPGIPPAYPGPRPGDAIAIWQQDSDDSNAQRRITRLTGYVKQLNDRAHEDYLDACQRMVERLRADQAVAEALAARHGLPPNAIPEPVPGQSPGLSPGQGPDVPGGPSYSAEFADEDDTPPATLETLEAAAAELFAGWPDVTRDRLQKILRCGSGQARRLHANRPGAAQ